MRTGRWLIPNWLYIDEDSEYGGCVFIVRDECNRVKVAEFAQRSLLFLNVVARNESPRHQVRPSIHHSVAISICAKKSSPERTDGARRFAALRTVAPLDHSPSSNAAARVMCKD